LGAAKVTITVLASGASIDSNPDIRYDAGAWMLASRSHDHLTSAASTGEPSAKVAAGSSVKVNWVLSALASHSVARRGSRVLGSAGSTVISVS
jgi:hypothetical protein